MWYAVDACTFNGVNRKLLLNLTLTNHRRAIESVLPEVVHQRSLAARYTDIKTFQIHVSGCLSVSRHLKGIIPFVFISTFLVLPSFFPFSLPSESRMWFPFFSYCVGIALWIAVSIMHMGVIIFNAWSGSYAAFFRISENAFIASAAKSIPSKTFLRHPMTV